MAASLESATTTASTYTPEIACGRHIFEVTSHSLLKGLGVGEFIQSAVFTVGGYDWCLDYYPDGEDDDDSYDDDYASVFLRLMSEGSSKVRALFEFKVLNPATSVSVSWTEAAVFNGDSPSWGSPDFMKKSDLEASYLQDDRLVIQCDLTVILETPVSKSKNICEIQVPPSDLLPSLGKLLESADGADVKFKVQDEVFHAHKTVLAMRSPVFKAELFGPMSGKSTKHRTLHIEDMQPAVFKALLHFMYNDSLPAMDDLEVDETEEMVKHLLVAADRYAVERMKVICESILSKKLDVKGVAAALALADQHHCSQLKNACIEFMNSSNRLDEVVDSEGYAHLKRGCPTVIAEIWEKSAKSRKI